MKILGWVIWHPTRGVMAIARRRGQVERWMPGWSGCEVKLLVRRVR